MERYLTTDKVDLLSGVLDLNEDQARRRKGWLKKLESGLFEIIKPVQFKAGEVFGFDGELSKYHLERMISESGETVVKSEEPQEPVTFETIAKQKGKAKK